MNSWSLELCHPIDHDIDASGIELSQLTAEPQVERVKRFRLSNQHAAPELGELFSIHSIPKSHESTIVLKGDLKRVHCLGGNMKSGRLIVEGNIGNYLGAAHGASRAGMSGGRIVVTGTAGNYVGFRMRRGEIFVEGNAGEFLAAHLTAGTIVVAGSVGKNLAYAMRRGTLVLAEAPTLSTRRFSAPVPLVSVFQNLFAKQYAEVASNFRLKNLGELIASFGESSVQSIRGDIAVGGQGEILFR